MTTGKNIVDQATKYLGKNGKTFCADAGIPWGSHWCCAFVWDIFRMKNASKLFCGGKNVVYVPTAQQWLKANCKKVSLTDAKAGDIVIFTWSGKGYNKEVGSRDHIGFVRQKGTKDTVYTIEGNTGASDPKSTTVMRRNRAAKYIFGIYRPNYDQYYTIKFSKNGGDGKMSSVKVKVGSKIKLPKNKFTRAGFKFAGWAVKQHNVWKYTRFQKGVVEYKNTQSVKNLAKADKTITLYACWKGYGPEAAALWARKIAANKKFTYGVDNHKNWKNGRDRAHQVGCHFCGTTVSGAKKAKKGDKWDYTYCCNSFVFAALCHGANLFTKCKGGSTKASYWTNTLKKGGKPLYKTLGKNVAYSTLRPGDLLVKEAKHIKIFTGKSTKKPGYFLVSHAAGEGWGASSIRTDRVKGRIGTEYTALRYIGRK